MQTANHRGRPTIPIDPSAPTRVYLFAVVTDIPGDPLDRANTLAQVFCQRILNRPFQPLPAISGYDHVHVPPSFDSLTRVRLWFVCDLNVTTELDREQLNNVDHFIYLASRLRNDNELTFIQRNQWVTRVREKIKSPTWGGRAEQGDVA